MQDRKTIETRRRKALAEIARQCKRAPAAILISRPEDVGYLSGFTGEDSVLVFARNWATLITDGRYTEQAQRDCGDIDIKVRDAAMSKAIVEVLKARKIYSLGVQSSHMTMQIGDDLGKAIAPRRVIPLNEFVLPLRAEKDVGEIQCIRRASAIAQKAFCQLIAGGRRAFVGKTERQIAAELDYKMMLLGAQEPSFEIIVAAGANGSLPHYRPGNVRIKPNQAVLVDWGAKVNGYCSDLTRVVFTGKISPQLAEIYAIVARAQKAGIAAVGPGVSASSADAAARDVIAKAGYEKSFVHSLGHGIGRHVHEMPSLSRLSKARLKQGMVVTVEPGIYIPGLGGVRIEDDVLVTRTGRLKLTKLTSGIHDMVLR